MLIGLIAVVLVQTQLYSMFSDRSKAIEDCEAAQTLVRFVREIADGMNYLSGQGFVHRDLSARNILLDANHVKVHHSVYCVTCCLVPVSFLWLIVMSHGSG